jgi:hypothetical protein
MQSIAYELFCKLGIPNYSALRTLDFGLWTIAINNAAN